MRNFISTAGGSGDLFSELPSPVNRAVIKPELLPELITARLLCRRLRNNQASPDKRRITRLICLNLVSMLKHGQHRPRAAGFISQD